MAAVTERKRHVFSGCLVSHTLSQVGGGADIDLRFLRLDFTKYLIA